MRLTLLFCFILFIFTGNTQVIFSEDFETAGLNNFSAVSTSGTFSWSATSNRGSDPGHSATMSAYFGDPVNFNYNSGTLEAGTLTSGLISLPSGQSYELSFNYFNAVESSTNYDVLSVQISTDGVTYSTIESSAGTGSLVRNSGVWEAASIDLTSYAGSNIYLRFDFNTIDGAANNFEGVYVDDILIEVKESSYFTRVMGTSGGERLFGMTKLSDGNIVVVGGINTPSNSRDMWVVKMTTEGDTLWARTVGYTGGDEARSVTELNNGYILIAGELSDADGNAGWIVLNSSGTSVINSRYSSQGAFNEEIYSVDATSDGGAMLSGTFNDGTYANMMVMKVNSVGNMLWQRNWNDASWSWQYASEVKATTDGGAVIFGGGNGAQSSNWNGYICKLTSTGAVSWQRYIPNGGYDEFKGGCLTSDGGYMAVGYSDGFTSGQRDVWLVKFNSSGTVVWSKSYGGSQDDQGFDVIETQNGDYVIAGQTDSYDATNTYGLLMRVDVNGNLLWSRAYGGNAQDIIYQVEELGSGDLIFAGENGAFSSGFGDGYVSLVTADGEGGGCSSTVQFTELSHTFSSSAMFFSTNSTVYNTYRSVSNSQLSFNVNDPVPTISQTLNEPLCHGGNGNVDISLTGGVAPFSYQWSSGGTAQDLLNQPAGQYYVDIEDNLGCNISDTFTITEPTPITGVLTGTNVTCFAQGDGAVDLAVSGGTPNYSYHWSNSASTEDLSAIGGGFYQVTITDNNGCTEILGISITEPSPLNVGLSNTTNVSCNGACDGSLVAVSSGGTGNKTYQWNDPSSQTGSTASSLCPGNYLVTVTDDNGCTNIANGIITEPDAIVLTGSSTGAECSSQNGTAEVFANGGTGAYTFQWSNGSNGSSISGVNPGNYTVTVSDANGCNEQIVIIVNDSVQEISPCIIGVTDNNQNLVVWEKPVQNGIAGFNIYRDVTGSYIPVGYVAYDSLSEFVDLNPSINPMFTSYRYKISILDSCGNEGDLGAFHETIHLTSNVGVSGEVNLIWDSYEGFGFNYYRILRDSTGSGNWEVIDSVSNFNFTYTDVDVPLSGAEYLIEVIAPSTCTSTRANNHNTSRSNKTQPASGGPDGILENESSTISVYPNPSNGQFTVSWDGVIPNKLALLDAQGKLLWENNNLLGLESIAINELDLSTGIYYLRVLTNGNLEALRLVVE